MNLLWDIFCWYQIIGGGVGGLLLTGYAGWLDIKRARAASANTVPDRSPE